MSYREAVRLAKGKLERLRDIPDQAEMLATYALHAYVNGEGENIATLVELSQTQGLSWDAAKLVAMEFILKGHALPESLRCWTVAVLAGDIKKPKTPKRFSRGWPGDLVQRNIEIHAVVSELLAAGVPFAMSSDSEKGHSACHAVAQALTELRMETGSYDTIRKIYSEREAELRAGRNLISPVGIMSQVISPTTEKT
ncbi:MAG: hypothetical protein ACPGNV_08570 [Mangrovicoccus sp.]